MPYVETLSDRLLSWFDHTAVRRSMALALLGLLAVPALVAIGRLRLPANTPGNWSSHLAGDLENWHKALAKATKRDPQPFSELVCKELHIVAAKYNEKLSGNGFLDASALLQGNQGISCPTIAKRLARTLDEDFHLIRGALARSSGKGESVFEPIDRDYRTLSAYTAMPGCWVIAGRRQCGSEPMHGMEDAKLASLLAAAGGNVRYELKGATAVTAGRAVPIGEDVATTLDPALETIGEKLAQCLTGATEQCHALPAWVPREVGLRAGAIGLVVLEVESGRIVALSGAVSECVAENLGVRNTQRGNATSPSYPCANYPDARLAWLAEHHPALWAAYPSGSTAKIGVIYGAAASGLISERDLAKWTPVIAASHDLTSDGKHHQNKPRELALSLGGKKLAAAYDALGYRVGGLGSDLYWGAQRDANWFGPLARRPKGLEFVPGMTWREFKAIEDLKKAHPAEADRKYPEALVERYLEVRRVADAAIGGGNMQISAVGLAEVLRQLKLAELGKSRAPRTHLLESRARNVEQQEVRLDRAGAQYALRVMSHVTDPKVSGTAAPACTRVGGQTCRDIIGKTGTSDFLPSEDGPGDCKPKLLGRAKDGSDLTAQMPGKLFVGLVSGSPGKPSYVVAATALRTAKPGRCLDDRNVAAEAAMVMVRVLREGTASRPM